MKDLVELGRDMALAIMRDRTARGSAVVGKDGRQRVTFQMMQAGKQLDDAMEAFCLAVGMPITKPDQYTDAEALLHWTGLVLPEPDEPTSATRSDSDLIDMMHVPPDTATKDSVYG